MKKILTVAVLLATTIGFAQNDKVVTTEVKKQKVMKNGEMVNKKTKIITEKKQKVAFDKSQRYELNQDRVPAPVETTKIYMIDNDKDPFYDKITKVKYYDMDNKKFALVSDENTLKINQIINDDEMTLGKAVRSKYNDYYIINSKKMNGVGYFTKDNEFVIEYYSPKNKKTQILIFQDAKF